MRCKDCIFFTRDKQTKMGWCEMTIDLEPTTYMYLKACRFFRYDTSKDNRDK